MSAAKFPMPLCDATAVDLEPHTGSVLAVGAAPGWSWTGSVYEVPVSDWLEFWPEWCEVWERGESCSTD